jgi:hypothetical protein
VRWSGANSFATPTAGMVVAHIKNFLEEFQSDEGQICRDAGVVADGVFNDR